MNIFLKAFLFLVSFDIFHFGYEVTKLPILKIFCGTNESIFQHLKMGFWGYFLLAVIEYFLIRKSIKDKDKFIYSRLFSTIIIPWVIVLVWYLYPAIFGRAETLFIEIIWALLATYLSGLLVIQIEREIEKISFSKASRIVIIILFVISAFLFTIFTFKLPWIDLFIDPSRL